MGSGIILVVSCGTAAAITKAIPWPGFAAKVCSPEKVSDHADTVHAEAVIIDGSCHPRRDFAFMADLKTRRPEAPIVYLSEGGEDMLAVEAFRNGARDYYRKPVDMLALRENIKSLVALKNNATAVRKPYLALSTGTALPEALSDLPLGILKVVTFIADNMGDDINLTGLAGQAGMSKYHFCRTFRKHLACSPMKYLLRLRLERARSLLRHSDLSASEISFCTGFSSLSAFSKAFKKSTSATPTDFRRGRGKPGS